jgi:hypothetical protein
MVTLIGTLVIMYFGVGISIGIIFAMLAMFPQKFREYENPSINSILDKIEGEDLIFHLILFFMVVFLWLPIYIMPFGGNKNE